MYGIYSVKKRVCRNVYTGKSVHSVDGFYSVPLALHAGCTRKRIGDSVTEAAAPL
jgi:hypothetical protein